jgi:hypothetical protein
MDISEKKNIPQDLLPYIKLLQLDNNKIQLMGTGGLKSQFYYSDFDLFSSIEKKLNDDDLYKKFMKILNDTENNNNLYFIEMKIQYLNGDKKKFFNINEVNEKDFIYSKIEFIKLDYVLNYNNIFTELSLIYSLNSKFDEDKYIESITNDMDELYKEGNYYKVLKRLFAILNFKQAKGKLKNKDLLIILSSFFNSDIGKMYQTASNLKAIKLLLENYDDEETIRRALVNLKDIKVEPNLKKIDSKISNLMKKVNQAGKKVLESIMNDIKF